MGLLCDLAHEVQSNCVARIPCLSSTSVLAGEEAMCCCSMREMVILYGLSDAHEDAEEGIQHCAEVSRARCCKAEAPCSKIIAFHT